MSTSLDISHHIEKLSSISNILNDKALLKSKTAIPILQKNLKNVITELTKLQDAFTKDTGNVSDGYHTFNELYHHRALLFAVVCSQFPNIAWKSKHHDDPENNPMYDGMFICGIETPEGQATYHYDLSYWDKFNVKEFDHAPKYDGHTPEQAIERIFTLTDFSE